MKFGVVYLSYADDDVDKKHPLCLINLNSSELPHHAVDISNGELYSFDDDEELIEIGRPAFMANTGHFLLFEKSDEPTEDNVKAVLFDSIMMEE